MVTLKKITRYDKIRKFPTRDENEFFETIYLVTIDRGIDCGIDYNDALEA